MDRPATAAPVTRSRPTAGRVREPTERPVAIVGMAAHFGPFEGLAAFQDRVLGGEAGREPARRVAGGRRRRPRSGSLDPPVRGFYLDSFRLRVDRFRIPPRELEEMLPQQSLMLKVAAEAIEDAGWDPASGCGPAS